MEQPSQVTDSPDSQCHELGGLKGVNASRILPEGRGEKLVQELWGMTMKDSDIAAYTTRFSDLSIQCPRMVTSESKQVERYIWGPSLRSKGM